MTPNRIEAEALAGIFINSDRSIRTAGEIIIKKFNCCYVVITLGEDGMVLLTNNGQYERIPTAAQEVFDVAGAGDTVIASLALASISNNTMLDAVKIANAAAGIVVGKAGTATASSAELSVAINRLTVTT